MMPDARVTNSWSGRRAFRMLKAIGWGRRLQARASRDFRSWRARGQTRLCCESRAMTKGHSRHRKSSRRILHQCLCHAADGGVVAVRNGLLLFVGPFRRRESVASKGQVDSLTGTVTGPRLRPRIPQRAWVPFAALDLVVAQKAPEVHLAPQVRP